MYKHQKGFSLSSVVIFGALIVLAIVYGRHIINIHYKSYALTAKAKDIVKENPNADDKTILKALRTKAEFDRIGDVYEDSDVLISKDGGNTVITINYRECAKLNKNWEICADQEIKSN